jgi:hypothetical protein
MSKGIVSSPASGTGPGSVKNIPDMTTRSKLIRILNAVTKWLKASPSPEDLTVDSVHLGHRLFQVERGRVLREGGLRAKEPEAAEGEAVGPVQQRHGGRHSTSVNEEYAHAPAQYDVRQPDV